MHVNSIIFVSVLLGLLVIIIFVLIILEILFEQGKFKKHKPIKESTSIQDVFDIIEKSISDVKSKYLSENKKKAQLKKFDIEEKVEVKKPLKTSKKSKKPQKKSTKTLTK